MIEKGDWVRVTRLHSTRGRIGEVVWARNKIPVNNSCQYRVKLFGEPPYTELYFAIELVKLNEMEVLAEAAR